MFNLFNRNRFGFNSGFGFGSNSNFGSDCGCNQMPQQECVITEPTITKCCEKEFYHEVPHVCPIHTHTINKHIYNHTYTPQYTYSEEDQVVDNNCGGCSGF